MKASELIKLLQKAIDLYGDHRVYMMDDYHFVGQLEWYPIDIAVRDNCVYVAGEDLFCLHWARPPDFEIWDASKEDE